MPLRFPLPRSRPTLREILAPALIVLAVLPIATLWHRITEVTRGTPVTTLRLVGDAAIPPLHDPAFTSLLARYAGVELEPGNRVEILTDGPETFRRIEEDIAQATRSITVQAYYCQPGRVADGIVRALAERARAGVRVFFLGDDFGCRSLLRAYGDELGAAGVEVARFRPIHWYTLHKAQHRSHIRLVIVDGRVAYTGGFGLDDKWIGTPGAPAWRDTNVRVVGPVAGRLQAVFARAWIEATGELLAGHIFFPVGTAAPAGDDGVEAGVVFHSPGLGSTSTERHLALLLSGARERLYITNSYFVPNPLTRRLLVDAARRGVDVRILVPGPHTDIPSARYAGRGYYEELLAAGVRIWEHDPTMMHAKTIVADGLWSSIGSMNMDNRSLRLNDEANVLIRDAAVAAAMDSIFIQDLGQATEIHPGDFAQRSRGDRVREWVVRQIAPLL